MGDEKKASNGNCNSIAPVEGGSAESTTGSSCSCTPAFLREADGGSAEGTDGHESGHDPHNHHNHKSGNGPNDEGFVWTQPMRGNYSEKLVESNYF